jgi:predicted dehydrogenase
MNEVRLGVIGVGGMGGMHARAVIDGKIPRAVLTALADSNPAPMTAAFPGVPAFATGAELIRSGLVDAVLIATPHFAHTSEGIAALQAGLHVLVEKPISVHKADCERLIAAYQPGRQIFAAMFNQRTDPLYLKLREMIQGGELGAVRRIQWTVTNWFRSQAYYDSGGWRATWAGEGGGVLLNQCPHNLDLWQWLFGMPDAVRAFTAYGRYHAIEVEDDVTAYLQYRDGTTGVFIASTGEAPGTNRIEIAAERGRAIVENGQIVFTRNEIPMSEFSRTTTARFDPPPSKQIVIPTSDRGTQHQGIMTNFVAAILDGAPLLAPAEEGIHSVELANAMLLSSSAQETISLPLDSSRYEKWLRDRIAESKAKPAGVRASTSDLTQSFKA